MPRSGTFRCAAAPPVHDVRRPIHLTLLQALQDGFGMTCEVLTGGCESDATACSFQQRHAGFTFEDGQLLRHRGGTERQRLGNGNDGSAQR